MIEAAPASNISVSRARVPHSAGDLAPAGGGRYLPSVLKTCPINPSGVQFARPILPLGRQTRKSSAAAWSWFGVNITPKVERTVIEIVVAERQVFGIGLLEFDRHAFGFRAGAAVLQQRGHVVGRGDVAPAPRGSERRHAVAGGDIEHFRAGAEIERFAELLTDDLQRRADDGVVAGRPCGLLSRFEGGKIGGAVARR